MTESSNKNLFSKIGCWFKSKWNAFKTKCSESKEGLKQWSKRIKERSFKENMKYLGRSLYNQRGWLWLLPIAVLMAIFTFWPIINTSIMAFQQNYDGYGFDGIGFGNFVDVIKYPSFKYVLSNTLLFAFISVPVSTLLALFISVGLNSIKWVQKAYQTVFFLPYLTNSLAIGAVFATMFTIVSPTGTADGALSMGLINNLFGTKINWTMVNANNLWANRFVVIIYEIWSGLPFKILIIFSSLQSVNKQYYDAAKIDGTSKNRTLWKITVPLISPMLSYLIITGFIGGFKAYTAVVGIFGATNVSRRPINTMVGFIYDNIADNPGLAAAGSLVLFGIILVFTIINFWVSKKRVHY